MVDKLYIHPLDTTEAHSGHPSHKQIMSDATESTPLLSYN